MATGAQPTRQGSGRPGPPVDENALDSGARWACPSGVRRLRLCAAVLGLSAPLVGAAQTPPPLRVGVAGDAPFVVVKEGQPPSGMSVDVFRAIARDTGLSFTLEPVPGGVAEGLRAVSAKEVDLLVGPLSITAERLEAVQFTRRYFEAPLSLVTPTGGFGLREVFGPFVGRAFLIGVAVLLCVLLSVGVAIWLAERRRNPEQFPRAPVPGIANGVWFALVTFTTVGYGDRAPLSVPGRVIAGVWMLTALVGASSLTAGIATALTLRGISHGSIVKPEELLGQSIAAQPGTVGEQFARSHGAIIVPVSSISEGFERVQRSEAAAVIEDRPVLQHWLVKLHARDLVLGEGKWRPADYGFALPLDSDLTHRLNLALQGLRESGELQMIEQRWLPDEG